VSENLEEVASRQQTNFACVSENLEEVARRQQTNFAFESADFAFLSSVATSPKER
jgi:hypothetical protein